MGKSTKKSYRELSHISSFEDRYKYLELHGRVGEETFGRARHLNQAFYQSDRWLSVRDQVILRDNGCDMGIPGHDISKYATVHHINPITDEDILNDADCLYDPDNLITLSSATHKAIHYGDPSLMHVAIQQERRPNDTCPWKE